MCFASILIYYELDIEFTEASETNDVEGTILGIVPIEPGFAAAVALETNCIEELNLDGSTPESLIVDTFEYVEFAVGLPDHLVNISGFSITQGSQPRPFLTVVKANMYIEGFIEKFAIALGLDDYLSKLSDHDRRCGNGVENPVVAAPNRRLTILGERPI